MCTTATVFPLLITSPHLTPLQWLAFPSSLTLRALSLSHLYQESYGIKKESVVENYYLGRQRVRNFFSFLKLFCSSQF
jgi:hypothetical protein